MDTFTAQTQALGALKATGSACSPLLRSTPASSPLPSSPFGSTRASSFAAPRPSFGAPSFQLPACSIGAPQPPYFGTGMVRPVSIGATPPMGFNMNPLCAGVGMAQSGSLGGNPQAAPPPAGMVQPSFIANNLQAGAFLSGGSTPQAGGAVLSGSQTTNTNTNPFLL
ncbi:hypothetical protein LDENG_00277370 [Lucifuga dentata]|nr:hypothetical protein LDENG_00277370 [Lucifuga dentata]